MFNPFLYVDPSGYTWFSKLGNWFRNNWESIVTTVVTVAVGVAVGAAVVASCGTAAPLLVAVCAGTAAGFAGGVTSGILSGQDLGGVMKSGLIGAGTGLVSGALGGVASTFAPAGALWGSLYGAGTGSIIGGVGSVMTGGDIKEGIIFGAATGLVSGGIQGYCSAKSQGLNPWTGAKLPETTNSQIKQNRINGRIAEDVSGIDQSSKVRIPSATGTAKYRIPDELTNSTLREIKNVSYLDYTPQLQDFVSYSQQHNLQMILQVRPENTVFGPGTIFSPALNNAINQYNIKVDYIPFPNKFIINF